MSMFLGVPMDAAYHVILALTGVLAPVTGGLAAVTAIVIVTAVVRFAVTPLSFRALRAQAAQARLAPRVHELRRRFARQPERLQREMTALYRKEGVSLLAGIWPFLVQWPIFSVLYLLFRLPTVAGSANLLLARTFLGVPLGSHWLSASVLSPHSAVFLGVFAVLAAACWLSARVARRVAAATGPDGPAVGPVGTLAKVLPYVTVIVAAFAPLAAAVYLTTSVAWSAAEREAFRRRTVSPT